MRHHTMKYVKEVIHGASTQDDYSMKYVNYECTVKIASAFPQDGPPSQPQQYNLSEEDHIDMMEAKSSCSRSNPQRRVSISETPTLNVYENNNDDLHLGSIAFSSKDRAISNAAASQEAGRIKDLIITAPQKSRLDSIKYLLKNNIVTKEELVGIEHMVFDKSSRRSEVRKHHCKAVLRKQQENQQQKAYPPPHDAVLALAKFARKNSLESRNSARVRAGLCCEPQSSQSNVREDD